MKLKLIALLGCITIVTTVGAAVVSCETPETGPPNTITEIALEQAKSNAEWKDAQNRITAQKLLELSTGRFADIKTVELPPNMTGYTFDNRVDGNGDGDVDASGYYYANVCGDLNRVDFAGTVTFSGGEVNGFHLNKNTTETLKER